MTPASKAEALDRVLSLAEYGWRLFPSVPRTKTPLLKGWPTFASSDPATIRSWAVKHPGCNWAVATGPGSGVFVLDVDGEKGRASLAMLEAQHGPLPATLASRTGREDGGEHRWFTWPVDLDIRNSTSKLGTGLHIRGDGGYAIIPPSIHPSGFHYAWIEPRLAIASPSAWLLEMVTSAARPAVPASEIGILLVGRRNDTLFRRGCYLRRKGWEQPAIESDLLEQNACRCRPPLPDVEIRTIAASAASYPVGGPDPLESAWQAIQGETHNSRYEQFVSLVCQLQRSRPGQPVILPLERIAALMECGWTSVRGYRKQAVMARLIHRVADPVPRRRAAEYRVTLPLEAEKTVATMGSEPSNTHHNTHHWLDGKEHNSHRGNHRSPRLSPSNFGQRAKAGAL
jgi:hypothetical protein